MQKAIRGFTMVELIVIITVIGILSTIGVVSFNNIQKTANDKQRYNQITIIGEALEKYYDANGKYPKCNELKTNPTSVLTGVDEDVFIPPNATSTAISCDTDLGNFLYYSTGFDNNGNIDQWTLAYYSDSINDISPVAEQISNRRGYTDNIINVTATYTLTATASPSDGGIVTYDNKSYTKGSKVALVATPNPGYEFENWTGNCSGSNASTTVNMSSNKTCTANFTAVLPDPPKTPIVTASTSGNDTTWSWDAVNCPTGWDVEYKYHYFTEAYDDYWNETTSNFELPTTTSYKRNTNYPGYTFTVEVKAICKKPGKDDLESEFGSAFYKRPPIMTTITNDTVTDRTTWSWNNVFCPTNNIVNYRYRFTHTDFDSTWQPENNYIIQDAYPDNPNGYTIENGLTKQEYSRNTAEEKTYTLEVQARCIRIDDSDKISNWSDTSINSYTRGLVTPIMNDIWIDYYTDYAYWRWNPIITCSTGTVTLRYKYYITNSSNGIETKNTGWQSKEQAEADGAVIGKKLFSFINQYQRVVGTVGNIYTLDAQLMCTSRLGANSAWSETKSASYSLDSSSNPAPEAPVITKKVFTDSKIDFEWTNPCPAEASVEYSIDYSTNYGTSKTNLIQTQNTYSGSIGWSEGRVGTIKVKARCIYNNVFKTLYGPQATDSLKRLITKPTTPIWTDVARGTYNDHPTTAIEVTSSCGSGSSLYGIADIYAPTPTLNYNKVSKTYYSGWYGNDYESTWNYWPYQNVGGGIRATIYWYIQGSSTPYFVPTGTKLQFKAKFYCQSDLTGENSAVSDVSFSGEKAVPEN